ncbi:ATP-binding protein [Candidatus Bathyarchaeota archaeon]|nr:ATP-binding protein [Candidatus Bathyarchaeota archaeon]
MPARKGNIDVSAKIIADISSGIYRTPANALKELVSNSFDADARTAIITTDYPDFDVITCTDDGEGMTVPKFEDVMSRIGGTDKRAKKPETTKLGRPIIGKIGIGILAVAQICRKFTVISSTKHEPKRFEATIDLAPFHEQEAYKYPLKDKKVRIGEYDIEDDIEEEKNTSYTRIIVEKVDEGFKNRLSDIADNSVSNFEFDRTDPKTFEEFTSWMEDKRVRFLPEYLRLLWELALVCPTAYLESGPVPENALMDTVKKRLLDYDFTVIVDGIKLMKPISFPYKRNLEKPYFDWKTYDIHFDEIIAGSRLNFSGYIYHQNVAVHPPELRGLIVRIRNVGIGGYDKSFLNFPQSAGPIITGMTGEIYVFEGLEAALNIDRNSFRETDPHYLMLQEVIFEKLSQSREKGGILADARYRSRMIQREKRKTLARDEYDKLSKLIQKIFGKYLTIEDVDLHNDKPVKVDIQNSKITIYNFCPILPRRIKERRLYEKLIIFYELSTLDSTNKSFLDKTFYGLLRGRR